MRNNWEREAYYTKERNILKKGWRRVLPIGLSACVMIFPMKPFHVTASAGNAMEVQRQEPSTKEAEEFDLRLPRQVSLSEKQEDTVAQVAETAKQDADHAVAMLENIDSEIVYNEAVKQTLDEYYSDFDVDDRVDDFVEELRPCAKSIAQNYQEAYEERISQDSLSYNPLDIIVEFDENAKDASIESAMDQLSSGGQLLSKEFCTPNPDLPDYKKERIQKALDQQEGKTAIIKLAKDQTTSRAIKEFEKIDGVHCAERDGIATLQGIGASEPGFDVVNTPNDPFYSDQWYMEELEMRRAWNIYNQYAHRRYIRVAVLDTGLEFSQEDLQGQFLLETSADITGDQPIKLVASDKQSDSSHGTHVAGVISSKTGNGKGIAGITDSGSINGTMLMAIKVTQVVNGEVGSSSSLLIKALRYAVVNGADIVNISMCTKLGSDTFQREIITANQAGVVIVASAGNDGKTGKFYPADYSHVISVIGLNKKMERWDEVVDGEIYASNYGNKDISAPAEKIMCGDSYNQYHVFSGTSLAAPIVSGIVALMLGINDQLTPSQIESCIVDTAKDLGETGYDEETAHGLISPVDCLWRVITRYK